VLGQPGTIISKATPGQPPRSGGRSSLLRLRLCQRNRIKAGTKANERILHILPDGWPCHKRTNAIGAHRESSPR
jgi:hypothetical protein